MREPVWRDPDLPDGVVRFPPEHRPRAGVRVRTGLLFLAALGALALWLVLSGRLP